MASLFSRSDLIGPAFTFAYAGFADWSIDRITVRHLHGESSPHPTRTHNNWYCVEHLRGRAVLCLVAPCHQVLSSKATYMARGLDDYRRKRV
jgi:hypothetical protein